MHRRQWLAAYHYALSRLATQHTRLTSQADLHETAQKKNALFVVIISDWWHLLISKNIKTQRLYLLEFRPVRRIRALGRATPAAAEKIVKPRSIVLPVLFGQSWFSRRGPHVHTDFPARCAPKAAK